MGKKLRKADYIAKYGEEAWNAKEEKRREYNKQYYQENKEHIAKQVKQYCQEHKEERKEYCAEYHKQYLDTQWGRAKFLKGNYIRIDKAKGLPTDQNIDEDWIIENIFGSSCIYCGESDWTKLGCDRIDNTKGHTPDNVVCSCRRCNSARKNNYSVQDFIKIKQEKNLQSTI